MAYKNAAKTSSHPSHPIRNFFYVLWSLLNTAAFAGVFVALKEPALPYRPAVLIGCATILLFAVVFGIFRPLFRGR